MDEELKVAAGGYRGDSLDIEQVRLAAARVEWLSCEKERLEAVTA